MGEEIAAGCFELRMEYSVEERGSGLSVVGDKVSCLGDQRPFCTRGSFAIASKPDRLYIGLIHGDAGGDGIELRHKDNEELRSADVKQKMKVLRYKVVCWIE